MRNFKDSDYALNKFSEGIVYKFADGIVEVTLEDYLRTNPRKTDRDFRELKALSDEIYHRQAVDTNRTSRLNVTISGMEETEQMATASVETKLLQKIDQDKALKAARELLSGGDMTEIQRRRFLLHFFQGLSTRQIAARENVSHIAVHKSILLAKEKLKKIFAKQG